MQPDEYFLRLNQSERPVVVDLWAPWCGPCRMVGPILKQLSRQYKDQVVFLEINADDAPELLRKLGVRGIPTLLVYHQGRELTRLIGAHNATVYADLFSNLAAGKMDRLRPFLPPGERMLRLGAGGAVAFLSAINGWWPLVALGLLIMAFGWYDRFPSWSSITARLRRK